MTNNFQKLLKWMVVLVLFVQPALAQNGVPAVLPFQGRVTDNTGSPINYPVTIKFRIYPPAGSCYLFEETHAVSPNAFGLFSVMLGSATSTGPANSFAKVFNNDTAGPILDSCGGNYTASANDWRRLEMVVDGVPVTGMQTIGSSAFAINSQLLEGRTANDFIQKSGTVNFANLTNVTDGSEASSLHHHDSVYAKIDGSNIFSGNVSTTGSIYSTTATGTIGVGTSTTSADIHVKKDSPTIRLESTSGAGGTAGFDFFGGATRRGRIEAAENANGLKLYSGSTLAVTLDSAGNLISAGSMKTAGTMGLGQYTTAQEAGLVTSLTALGASAKGTLWTNTTTGEIRYWDGAAAQTLWNKTASGVSAGNYGTATSVSTFSVDTFGRITAASNTAIALPPSQITQGGATAGQVLKWNGSSWTPQAEVGITAETDPSVTAWAKAAPAARLSTTSNILDLASSGVTANTYGSANQVPVFAVDAYGRVTSVTNTTITGVSPVGSALNSGQVWVGSSGNLAAAVAVSGDATISNVGSVSVNKIRGQTLSGNVAGPGSLLVYNNSLSQWEAQTLPSCTSSESMSFNAITGAITCVAVSNAVNFTGNLAGDITGTQGATALSKIQTKALTITSVADRDILQFNGTAWINKNIPACGANQYLTFNGTTYNCATDVGAAGNVSSLAASAPLAVTASTGAVTVSVAYDNISIGLNGSNQLQVIDGVTRTSSQTITGAKTFSGGLIDSSTGATQIAAGTTAQQPGSPTAGMIRINTSNGNTPEYWNGSVWTAVGSGLNVTSVTSANSYISVSNSTTTPSITAQVGTAANTLAAGDDARIVGALQKAGGTMTGSLNFSANTNIMIGNYTTDPTGLGAGDKGRIWYNTTDAELKYWDGTAVKSLGVAGSGLQNFNGATVASQSFAAPGTSGTAPAWSTNTGTGAHTLNIPLASAAGVTAGLLNKTDYDAFAAKLGTASTFSGDVSGTSSTISVDKIKGKAINPSAYAAGQVLRYDGTEWINTVLGFSDLGSKPTTLAGYGITDAQSTTLSTGQILVGNGSNVATAVSMSGDATLSSTGAITLNTVSVSKGGTNSTTALTNGKVMVSSGGAIVEGNASSTAKSNNTFVMRDGSGNIAGALGTFDQLALNGSVSGSVNIYAPSTFTSWNLTLPTNDGAAGEVLSTDGNGVTSWISASSGSVTNVTAGTGLNVGAGPNGSITSSGTLNIDVGTTANKIVQLTAAAKYPAVDGSLITNLDPANLASAVTITKGGTGQTTKTAAYDALSPNTTKGDLSVHNGTNNVRLPAGTNNYVLTADSAEASGLKWSALPSAPGDSSYAAKGLVQFLTDAATSGITVSSGVANVNTGTGANQIVKLDGTSKLPAVDGSALTNLSAGNIATGTLPIARGGTNSGTALTNGKVMVSSGGAIVEGVASNTAKSNNTFVMRDGSGNIAGALGTFDQMALNGSVSGTVSVAAPSSFTSYTLTLPATDGAAGEVLSTDGNGVTSWVPAGSSGTVTNITAGTGLNVGAGPNGSITTTGTLNIDVGTTASKIVQLTAAAKYPAVDGSLITNLDPANLSAAVAIANGGTGQTTKTAAYDALSPNTTKGDLSVYNGTNNIRLPAGTDNFVLTVDSTQPGGLKWAAASGGTSSDSSYAAKGIVQFLTDAATSGITIASGVANVNTGTGANQIVKLDGSAKLPVVDGSALTNLNAGNISTGTLSVARGGTGVTTFGNNTLLVTNGTGTLTPLSCALGEYLSFGAFGIASCGNASVGSLFVNNGNSFGASAVIGTNDSNSFAVETNGSVRMTIDSAGFVGIGTASPGQMLEVVGNIKATGLLSTSDARLKINVRPMQGLSVITKLNGVRYEWLSSGKPDFGVIAQEVEAVLPEAVETDHSSGFKSVKYQNLVSPLIESTKELAQQNIALKDHLAKLQKKNVDLEKRLQAIEKALGAKQ